MRSITISVAGVTVQVEDDGDQVPMPSYSFSLDPIPEPVNAGPDGVVNDKTTGLMWSQDDVLPKKCTFAEAEAACKALRLGGFDDWRMPTRKELLTLVDDTKHSPAIDKWLFPSCKKDWYWSSTAYAAGPGCAWIVYFGGGSASFDGRGYSSAFVRAVRSVAPGQ